MPTPHHPTPAGLRDWIRDWAETAECFALVISALSVTLGAALAWRQGYCRPGYFALTLIAGMLMQLGANLCNVYDGWVKGQDQRKDTFGDVANPLVQGRVSLTAVRNGAIGAFLVASLLGLYLTWRSGWPILVVGVLGLIGARSYTGGPLSYKESGLGPLLVFFLMGPMMVLPAYFIQRGAFEWWPGLAAVPLGLLISMVMQANDIRDAEDDRKTGVRSLAVRWGRRRALWLYAAMWVGAYLTQAWLMQIGLLPWTTAATVLIWPSLGKLARTYGKAEVARADLVALEKLSARLYMAYGALLVAGVVL